MNQELFKLQSVETVGRTKIGAAIDRLATYSAAVEEAAQQTC